MVSNSAESLRLLNLLSDEPTSNSILFQGKDYQYYSNAASVYMLQGKYHLACLFSQRAVEEVKTKSLVDKSYHHNRDGSIEDVEGGGDGDKNEENFEKIHRSVSPSDKAQAEAVNYSGSLPYRCTAEVLYNAALALLLTGNFLGALSYFEQITKQLGTRPILWIRMAECCIQHYTQQNGVNQNKGGSMLSYEGSTGRGRRLQFCSDPRSLSGTSPQSHLETDALRSMGRTVSDTEDGDISIPTSSKSANSISTSNGNAIVMNKAMQYLSNALYLIRDTRKKNETLRSTRSDNNDDDDAISINCTLNDNGIGNLKEFREPPQSLISQSNFVHSPIFVSSSSGTCNQKRLDELECTALSKLAYVHLELDSPLLALAAAKQIASFSSTHISELTR